MENFGVEFCAILYDVTTSSYDVHSMFYMMCGTAL